jgi:hypothetical protein
MRPWASSGDFLRIRVHWTVTLSSIEYFYARQRSSAQGWLALADRLATHESLTNNQCGFRLIRSGFVLDDGLTPCSFYLSFEGHSFGVSYQTHRQEGTEEHIKCQAKPRPPVWHTGVVDEEAMDEVKNAMPNKGSDY